MTAPTPADSPTTGAKPVSPRPAINLAEIGVLALVAIVVGVFFRDVYSYSPAARLVPLIFLYIAGGLLVLSTIFIARRVLMAWAEGRDVVAGGDLHMALRTGAVIGSVIGYLVLVYLIGLYFAIPIVVFLFAYVLGSLRWYTAALIAFATWLFTYLLFVRLLGLPTLPGILWP